MLIIHNLCYTMKMLTHETVLAFQNKKFQTLKNNHPYGMLVQYTDKR